MSTRKKYLEYIMEQLSDLDDISYRSMMGEYIIYYRGVIVGGIYDDRFLVKPMAAAVAYLGNISYENPYEGAKEMLLVDNLDNKLYLQGLIEVIYEEVTR